MKQTLFQLAAPHARWLARFAGALMVLFLLAFAIGEGPPAPWRLTGRELLYALGMAALYGGLALAWFHPSWGGVMSLAGWLWLSALSGRPEWDAPLAIPALTGLVHLACASAPPIRPRWVTPILYGPLPLFVLLAANEIFGNPPLLARPPQPADEIAGAWNGPGAATVNIDRDGRLTGQLWDAPLDAQLRPNRTPFGRLLGWRTDYAALTAGRYVCLIDAAGDDRLRVYDSASARSMILQR